MVPLCFDISSTDSHLVNGVDLRIRLDSSPASMVINSLADDEQYTYRVESAKLFVEKVMPHQEALLSLERSLIKHSTRIEYLFDQRVTKTFVFPVGHTTMTLDNMYSGLIPQKICLFFYQTSSCE